MTTITNPIPKFYLLMKIHKVPLTTRPIVSFSGTLMYGLGIWLDHQLQKIVIRLRSYVKSSFDLKTQLLQLELPINCSLSTADATSMYTNIPTDQAINDISTYLFLHRYMFDDIPIRAVLDALHLLMRNNMFSFGDTYWLQLSGTAMGAPPAPMYATLAFGTHEEIFLDRHPNLFFYRRYIDDIFVIWTHHPCLEVFNGEGG